MHDDRVAATSTGAVIEGRHGVEVRSAPVMGMYRGGGFARTLAMASLALALAGCSTTHECTEIGCMSQLSITMRTPTGEWPDGLYILSVRTDTHLEGICTFLLPDQLPKPPEPIQMLSVDCGSMIRLDITPETECKMGCNGNSCWQECTPIPGKFAAHVSIGGTPARVDLNLMRDDAPILVETAQPIYSDVYPNGPECGPACRQATVEYTLQ